MTTKDAPARARIEGEPQTLQQAHDVLRRRQPRGTRVSANHWQAYHEQAAQVYAAVAEVDADHHHEALYFASVAQEDAQKLRTATVPSVREEK